MNLPTAVVLLSGGLDSTTLLAQTIDADVEVKAAVFAQTSGSQERRLAAAREVAEHYRLDLTVLDLQAFGDQALGNVQGVMLSAAAGVASFVRARAVLVGVNADDAPMSADRRPQFIDAMSIACALGCGVRVSAPFASYSKADIAKESCQLQVPVHYTWSCTGSEGLHCGVCSGCVARAAAFRLARVPDPTAYTASVGLAVDARSAGMVEVDNPLRREVRPRRGTEKATS